MEHFESLFSFFPSTNTPFVIFDIQNLNISFTTLRNLHLYAFSPQPFTPPQPNPPPSPTSILPLDFVHVSFIVVPVITSPHYPLLIQLNNNKNLKKKRNCLIKVHLWNIGLQKLKLFLWNKAFYSQRSLCSFFIPHISMKVTPVILERGQTPIGLGSTEDLRLPLLFLWFISTFLLCAFHFSSFSPLHHFLGIFWTNVLFYFLLLLIPSPPLISAPLEVMISMPIFRGYPRHCHMLA